jgi:hypothetical protein
MVTREVLHYFVFIFGIATSPYRSLDSIWEHILVLLLVRVLLPDLASATVEATLSGLLVFLLSEVCILLQIFIGLFVDLWRAIGRKLGNVNANLVAIPPIQLILCHYESHPEVTWLYCIFLLAEDLQILFLNKVRNSLKYRIIERDRKW